MHWTEDYRLIGNPYEDFRFVHVPSGTILLITTSVSMETLNGLMREFDTFGTIRKGWREWWAEDEKRGNRDAAPERRFINQS